MKLEIKKKLLSRSERVKSVELHPTLPWVLIALYAGNVTIFDYNQQTQIKSFEVTNAPVRCAKFIARKQWIIVGADDTKIRVYNYNTLEKLKVIDDHTDFIRYLAIHPQLPYVLSCSDDQTIKLFDWDKNWQKINSYEDHEHYIMQIAINPKDPTMFASASLDKTIKIWTITNKKTQANYSLLGHQAGVNCIDFSIGFDRPHLVSGGDDGHVKVWDYQTKQCLFTFDKGHTDNVSAVSYHPDLPIILSAGEDNIINIWNAITFKHETTLNYGLQRVWAIHALPESNYVAFGFDEATVVIKIGKEFPMVSFNNGKLVWVKQSEIQTVNLKLIQEEVKDGQKLKPIVKDLGHSDTFPQSIKFSPTGRYFAICGDTDFVIFQYPKFQNAAFGNGNDLVWATVNMNQNIYAVKNDQGIVKVFKNFVEHKTFKTNFQNEGIYGGRLLAIKSKDFITFYDWDQFNVIRRIDVNPSPKNVFWSENGNYLVLGLEETFYLLQFNIEQTEQVLRKQSIQASTGQLEQQEEDGIEDAFTFIEEFHEAVSSGCWISNDCFVFVNSKGIISYLLGNKIIKLTTADKKYFMLGYDSKQNRLYMVDKSLNIVCYSLLISLVNYQSAILNDDIHGAQAFFKDIPESFHSKLAKFLESNNQKEMAFEITPDKDHKFELAINLNKIDAAFQIAEEQEATEKWKKVGDIALVNGNFNLAEKCFTKSQDFNSLLLFYSSYGDEQGINDLVNASEKSGKYNVALQGAYLLGDSDRCISIFIKSKRIAEAAMFARAYAPSKIPEILKLWEDLLKQRELPFQPENILTSESQSEIMEQALAIENELQNRFYGQEKSSAEEYEAIKEEYYKDFVITE